MPLTQDQEDLEHKLRVETMSIGVEQARMSIEQARANIEQMRVSGATNAEKLRAEVDQIRANAEKLCSDMRYESRKFLVQSIAVVIAAFTAGVGALGLVLRLSGKL